LNFLFFFISAKVRFKMSSSNSVSSSLRSIDSSHCQCSGYRGIPVHLLLGPFNSPASAQGWNDNQSQRRRPS
jgi:hypothetical protein